MKYSKSAIGLLTAQYRSVLKKCWMINVGLFALGAALATPAEAGGVVNVVKSGGNWNVTVSGDAETVTVNTGGNNIATVDLSNYITTEDLGSATAFAAYNDGSGNNIANTYLSKTEAGNTYALKSAISDMQTKTEADGKYALKESLSGYATAEALQNLIEGTTAVNKVTLKGTSGNAVLSYVSEDGKVSVDQAFQANNSLLLRNGVNTASLNTETFGATLGLATNNMRISNLYVGSDTTPVTGVVNTISTSASANNGKLATATAVKNYADGLSAAVYDGSNAFAKFKMGEVEVDGITAASTGDTKKLITETAVDGKITAATTDLSADVATLKGGVSDANSVSYKIFHDAEDAEYTGAAAANSIGAAIKGNADKLAGLEVDAGAVTVQNAINKAKTEAQTYSGTAVSGADTVSEAIDKNATSIADLKDASKDGSIAKLIKANAKDATYEGETTISEAISAVSGSIGTEALANANGNLNGGTTGTFTGSVKAAINGLDATLGKIYGLATGGKGNLASTGDTVSGHLSALDNAIGNRTTAYGTSHYAASGNADLNVATAIKNLDTAVYNNLNGISTATLNIGGSAKDVHIGKDGEGLNIASTGATLLTKDGSSITNGLTIGSTDDATSSLGYTNETFRGIKVSKTSTNADTVTITDGTNNVVFKGGKMTANGAVLSTLKMGDNEAKGIDTGTNYAAADATAPAADNIQLASTATVYNSVHALAGQMGNFETIANVHGVNGTESLKFGEKANNIRIGSENLIGGNKVLATGIDVNGLVSGTKGINLRVANGDSSDNNTSVNVTESQVKLGSTVNGKFYGITSNYDGTVPADSSIKFTSDDKVVEVKGGNLNADGDIKTAAGTVEGAHLKATTDLQIGDFTPVVGVDDGTSDLDNTANNTMLASAKTVYRAMSSAQGYTPADALKADTHIFKGVTTNKAALDIVGTKLDGLTMADGTTAAATVQAALQDVKSAADTAVNNLKDGDVAANKAKLAGLVVDPNASPAAEVTVQNAINYAKTQAGVYTSATDMQAEGKIFNGLTTFTDAMDAAGAGIMANTARFAGFASATQTVAEYVDANAKDATYSSSGGTKVTIAQEIAKKANTADLKTAAYRDIAGTFTPDLTDYHDTDIATWVAANGSNIADVTTTFNVLSKKLSTVQHDLMANGDTASSIARALGGTAATDTLPGMVQKLALNAPYSSTADYDEGSIGEAVQKNTAKFGDLGTNTVAQAIATAGTTADGKYVAKNDLKGSITLGKEFDSGNIQNTAANLAIDTAARTISAEVRDDHANTQKIELSDNGLVISKTAAWNDPATTNSVTINDGNVTADGVVSAAGLKLGANDVTSIDAGEALDITTDVAAADKKVMATDAAVKATVKALAEGAVKTNTNAITKLNGEDNVDGSVKNSIKTLASDATYKADSATGTIGGAIKANADAIAANKATLDADNLVVEPSEDPDNPTPVTVQNAINYAKKQAQAYAPAEELAAEGAIFAGVKTNKAALDIAGEKLTTLNGGKTVENSVDYKVYNDAASAKYDDSGKTIKTAIQEAASGASDALNKVLNGTTAFSKLNLGAASVTGTGDNFKIKNSDGKIMSQLLNGGYYLYNNDNANPYLTATTEQLNLRGANGISFQVYNDTGNVFTKGNITADGDIKGANLEAKTGLKVGASEVMTGVDNGREALTENASSTTLASAATVYTTVKANAEKATYTPATGEESAAVITAQANTINGAILALDKNAVATNNAIGNINNLNGDDNAMMDYSGNTPVEAANIVEAVNNISSTLGTIHGLRASVENGDFDAEGSTWYKDGAGNLFAGSEVDDHLAELAASIGNRAGYLAGHYTQENPASPATKLSISDAIKNMDTNIYNKISGIENDYVTKAYFNNGDDTNNAISMGSGAKDITIGSATNKVVVDNANHTIGATIDTSATDETINALTMDNTNGVKLATTKGLGLAAKTKNVAINNGVVTADDSLVASDTTAATSSTIKADGSATFKGANKTASIVDGDINADDINAATVTATTITGTTVNATTLAMAAGGEATAIDNTGTVMTAAPTDDGKTLASTLTVYNNIQDATTVAAATNGNYAGGSVKDALKTVDRNMGNLAWYNGTHYANTGSTKTSLAAAIKNMDTAIYGKLGDMNLTSATNYANQTAATNLTVTDAIKNIDTNVKTAIGSLDGKYVSKNYFNGEDGTDGASSPVIMGRSASSIQIGAQNFSGTGPTGLNSGIQIDVTRDGSGSITDSAISIGTNGNSSFDGIKVSSNGTNVVIGNSAGDKVTIAGGAVTATGAVQGASLVATAATDGLSINGKTASTIDNDGTVMTAAPADGKTLASTLTVYNNIQDATVFKAAEVTANTHNYAAGDTVKQAIASLDGVVGDIESYRDTKYANTSSTEDVDLAHAVINLDTAIFNVTKDYVTKTYFDGGDYTNHYISMGSLAKKVTIGADAGARIVLDVEDAAKKSITMTAGTDMQVALNGTEITIGDKDGQGIKVDNDGKTTTFVGSTADKKVVVSEGVVTASDSLVAGTDGTAPYSKIEKGAATFASATKTVSIADGSVTIGDKLIFGADNSYATGIDNTWGKFTAAPANNYTLATTKTVYDNTYLTAAGARGNYAAGSVLDAVASIDKAIGNRAILNGTNYANPGDSATTTNLAQAIKNMDTNVFAKVGTVDLSTAINYANTTTDPATNLTQAVVNIDKNVKAEINSLDNKFVTKDYFNNGEPAKLPDDSDNPNAGLISMGSGATQINIGKTVPAGTPTSAVLDSGLSINNTNGDVMLGQISQVGSGTTAKSVVETGVNVDNATHTASLISANEQSSINAVDVNQTTIKIGMTTTDNSGNPLFSGVSINNGVMTNADPADANKKATFASNEVKVASSATDYTSTTAAGTTVTKKDGDKTYTANMAADEVSVADGTNTASVKADEMSVADGNGNSASVKADKMSVTDGTNTSSMTATTVSMADKSGNSNTLNKSGMTVVDSQGNTTSVASTGVTVTNGTSTTTVAADGVTSSKFAFSDTKYVTDIDAGTDFSADNAPAADAYTIATTATVKNSIDGMVSGIEKQIHGDGPDSTVNIGDKAGTTFIGETYKDMAGKEQVAGGMAVRMTYEDPAADPAVVTNREVEITALMNDGSGVSVDLNAANQTIDLVAAGDDDDSATGVRINHKNQTITLVSADEDTEQTTGVEINNKNGTIAISSANDNDHTATGLSIVNDNVNNKHTIDLAYVEKDINGNATATHGLNIDGDNQTYSLGSETATSSSGLDINANTSVYTLGKSTISGTTKTLDYGMTMDAENGITSFANKDGEGVTMNKGDMTITSSATVGSVDAQGVLSGVKLDKTGTAQASESVTAGQVDGDGKLSGNGVQMKNDGSATFASTDGKVNIAKGSVQADNSALIGNKADDAENYIEFAMNSETDPDTGAVTKSAVATFASSDGNVEIAKGEVTADKKVTVGDDTNSVVLDKDGNIAATTSALIGSETDDGQGNKTLSGVKLDKDGNAQASNSILAGTEDDTDGLTGVKLDKDGNATASKSVNVGNTTGTDYASIAKDDEGKVTATFASEAGNVVIADGEVTADKKVTVGEDKVVLDDQGNITADKDLTVKGLGTFGKDKKVVINEGNINADGTVTGDKLVANTEFELAGTKVHSIDTGTAKVEEKGDVLATTASIFRNAEDGDYNAAEGTYTTVDATTINEALTAVDNIIGNFPDGLNYDNHNLDNGGQAKPENIVDAFNNIDATLGQIHGLAAKVGVENGSMNLGQNTTVEEHLTALAGSIGNRTSYTEQNVIKNNESVAKSLDALDMAVGDVSKLQSTAFANAGNLSDAVVQIDDKLQNLDGRVESVEHDLKDVHHELRRGMASMAAMSALVPNSRSTGKTSLSLGTGAYSGHAAVALGGFHYLTDNLMLNAGAAWSNSRDAVYRVGVTYSF